ncbi:MAG: kdo(2)-lipid A phosphoethanolamine 7''-transferase [Leptothrix sp. (in: Bacteria)]|jgi:KDO II ethanolaminephosphotransferase|nr:kdo(2)-lipid A phosphoethanolamine 7''-transferase [Leptothrix sp. (in: b-proteobacteria)]MBP7521245.1 kdo(2)-lipid A phosphoethanolamine 7''-transferase [Leptothrix sp. (in: b-proteobacteria)]HQY09349.1 kdo(2)-lipid A phosphoethanolamine 7''-transferase [Burkholderiaceae bacterium]
MIRAISRHLSSRAVTLLASTFYIGLLLNAAVIWRRAEAFPPGTPGWVQAGMTVAEVLLLLSLTGLLLSVAALAGRWSWRLVTSTMLLASAVCAYYMTRFNVVIGYGVLNAVFTTDHEMSGEVVGLWMGGWCLLFGVLPLVWLWRRESPCSLLGALGQRSRLGAWAGVFVLLGLGFLIGQKLHVWTGEAMAQAGDETVLRPSGSVAYAYVPTNWIVGAGLLASNAWQERINQARLVDPGRKFQYIPGTDLSDLVVVFVIGETARHDRFGMLGHDRPTTPRLAATPHVAGFAARSCDTATKLSLACMFVRPEGLESPTDLGPDRIFEDKVFAVYKRLGFHTELFAMQGEAGFYNRVHARSYKLKEMISAQPENAGRPVDDLMLLPEVTAALQRNEARARDGKAPGPVLLLLHTKGSHYLYTRRYPREFARWQPECMSTDEACSRETLLNSFDNSILFTDHVLAETIERLRTRKALLVYSSDHGESIDDNSHFHATPRRVAPPEQRQVPLIFWASDRFLADPVLAQGYRKLEARAAGPLRQQGTGHHNLFASMLGCIGVKSPDGGVTAAHNLCD